MTAVRLVLAPNPGVFTLEGTNTWVIGLGPSLVIDPGPADGEHLEAVAREAGDVRAILLTHHHPDHAPGAARLRDLTGAPVMAFDPGPREERIEDGAVVTTAGATLTAVHTPGHTPDHLVFVDGESRSMFTGDVVLGWGTSVIDPPEGDLSAYVASLRRMLALEPGALYPGHGPVVPDGSAKLREYLDHREEREREVLAALAGGPRTPAEMVPGIYAGYPEEVHAIAARSLLAHLLKLEAEGRVRRLGDPAEDRFELATPPAGRR
jgi:glyoxylase-like metal-dependent hydrolase (beta-lactamase superfamily II)